MRKQARLHLTAGVDPTVYHDFQLGERVMTREGIEGTVTGIEDGPYPGAEHYIVSLVAGLGGGEYGPGELRVIATTAASLDDQPEEEPETPLHLASEYYPELAEILVDRPPPEHSIPVTGAKLSGSMDTLSTLGSVEAPLTIHPTAGAFDLLLNPWAKGVERRLDPEFRAQPGGKAWSYDWCRFRKNRQCFFPEKLDEEATQRAGYAVWIPKLRGMCPRDQWEQQKACPVGEPGPHSGEAGAMPEVTSKLRLAGDRRRTRRILTETVGPEAPPPASFDWHFFATWRDVQAKARRLRQEGNVHLIGAPSAESPHIVAEVKGDHGVYSTVITRTPGSTAVAMWSCGCPWSAYSWGRTGPLAKYEGRLCSHALAVVYEVQARGMFGKTVKPDTTRPPWRTPDTKVQYTYDKPSTEPARKAATLRPIDLDPELHRAPAVAMAQGMLSQGSPPSVVLQAMASLGAPNPTAIVATAIKIKPFKAKQPGGFVKQVYEVAEGEAVLEGGQTVPADTLMYPTYDPRLGLDLKDSTPRVSSQHFAQGDTSDPYVMIALRPPESVCEALAAEGGEPLEQLHITLKYLGKASEQSNLVAIHAAMEVLAARTPPLKGRVGGYGCFLNEERHGGQDVVVATLDILDIDRFRVELVKELDLAGIGREDDYGFIPHLTIRYDSRSIPTSVPEGAGDSFTFDHLIVAIGPTWSFFPLGGGPMSVRLMGDGPVGKTAEIASGPWHESDGLSPDASEEDLIAHLEADHPHIDEEWLGFKGNRDALDEAHWNDHRINGEVGAHIVEAVKADKLDASDALVAGMTLLTAAEMGDEVLAELKDEPEPALPETTGEDEGEDLAAKTSFLQPGAPGLAWIMQGAVTNDSKDIANAAREHLARVAAKQFTPAEQRELINEGEGVIASNFDLLDIAGTHYEAIESAYLSQEDEFAWL